MSNNNSDIVYALKGIVDQLHRLNKTFEKISNEILTPAKIEKVPAGMNLSVITGKRD